MENKKPLIIAIVVLIIIITGGVLISKINQFKTPKNSQQEKEAVAEIKSAPVVTITEGIVEKSSETSVTLKNDEGGATIEITPDYSVYVMDGSAPVLTAPAELKQGSKVKLRHAPPGSSVISSDAALGTVLSADDKAIVFTTEAGPKTIDITSKPTIYMDNAGAQIIKQASDIKPGAIIAVGYFDDVAKQQAVVIRIDKL